MSLFEIDSQSESGSEYLSDLDAPLILASSNDKPIIDIEPEAEESEKERRRARVKQLADEIIENRKEEKGIKEEIELRHESALNLLLRKKALQEEISLLTKNIEETFREIGRQRERKKKLKEREREIWEEHSDHTMILMRDYKM